MKLLAPGAVVGVAQHFRETLLPALANPSAPIPIRFSTRRAAGLGGRRKSPPVEHR